MLWKSYRLRKNWQFQDTITGGRKIYKSNLPFTIFSKKNNLNNCRFGISIPQKIVKKANKRNYYKRQIRNIIIFYLKEKEVQLSSHFHCDKVIMIKKSFIEKNFQEKKNNLLEILSLSNFNNKKIGKE